AFQSPAGPASGATGAATGANAPANSDSRAQSAEAGRIMLTSLKNGSVAQDDVTFLGQEIAQRTGMSQADAEKRVSDTFAQLKAKVDQAKAQAKEAADKARKASAYA